LSFQERQPIDYERAVQQHTNYCLMLKELGIDVIELSNNFTYPDSTFIEDTAVVMDEIAILCNMGVASRRGEVSGIEPELAQYRSIKKIGPPATLEGGDVLRIGIKFFVGLTKRTNREGVRAFKQLMKPLNYEVVPVEVRNGLHLKSVCTSLDDETLLAKPEWFDIKPFRGLRMIVIPDTEAAAANCLRINNTICIHAGFYKTINLLLSKSYQIKTVDISELLKAEAGLTCSSIIFDHPI